jgi:hypothetical protein
LDPTAVQSLHRHVKWNFPQSTLEPHFEAFEISNKRLYLNQRQILTWLRPYFLNLLPLLPTF